VIPRVRKRLLIDGSADDTDDSRCFSEDFVWLIDNAARRAGCLDAAKIGKDCLRAVVMCRTIKSANAEAAMCDDFDANFDTVVGEGGFDCCAVHVMVIRMVVAMVNPLNEKN